VRLQVGGRTQSSRTGAVRRGPPPAIGRQPSASRPHRRAGLAEPSTGRRQRRRRRNAPVFVRRPPARSV